MRRHLTPGQLATVAQESLPLLEAEARERQSTGGRVAKSEQPENKVGEFVPQPSLAVESNLPTREKKATEEAAALVGANPRYVQDAKTIGRKTKAARCRAA